jgi:hypothetical protein
MHLFTPPPMTKVPTRCSNCKVKMVNIVNIYENKYSRLALWLRYIVEMGSVSDLVSWPDSDNPETLSPRIVLFRPG